MEEQGRLKSHSPPILSMTFVMPMTTSQRLNYLLPCPVRSMILERLARLSIVLKKLVAYRQSSKSLRKLSDTRTPLPRSQRCAETSRLKSFSFYRREISSGSSLTENLLDKISSMKMRQLKRRDLMTKKSECWRCRVKQKR